MASDKDRAKNLESYAHSLRKQLDDCRAELEEETALAASRLASLTTVIDSIESLRAELAAAKEALRLASEWAMESVGSCPLDQCDWTPPEGCKDRCGDDKVVIGCWVDYFLDAALRDGGDDAS